MPEGSHCRFDAESREYQYYIYSKKDPFLADRAYFYPYPLDWDLLKQAAGTREKHMDFRVFRNEIRR